MDRPKDNAKRATWIAYADHLEVLLEAGDGAVTKQAVIDQLKRELHRIKNRRSDLVVE